MTSLQIAEIADKRHKDLMRSIRKMEEAWHKVTGRNFALSEYTDSTGRTLPCYDLTKEECLYIATKFNDEARARLVLRWMELEEQIRRQTPQDISELLDASALVAHHLKQEVADGKYLPTERVKLNGRELALYAYLRNGILSSTDMPFITTTELIAKATGLEPEEVEAGWSKLEKGSYIISEVQPDGGRVFVLGNYQP